MDSCGETKIGLFPILIAVVSATLLYSWALPQFWISPDEGAHMMSAWRIHYGEVPFADYNSRQPFYTYIHAFSQLFFGNTLIAGRFVSLVSTVAAGWLIYLIGRKVQGEVVGLVAACLFLFSPLTFEYATIVQTQPVVILFECAAILVLLCYEERWGLALAGALLACAFYVRESSLGVVFAVFLWLFFMRGGSRGLLRQGIPFIAGYAGVSLLVILVYSQWLTLPEIWGSPINPLRLGVGAFNKILSVVATDTGVGPVSTGGSGHTAIIEVDSSGKPPSEHYLILGAQFIALIIVAAAGSLLLRVRDRGSDGASTGFGLLVFWLFGLVAVYTYWFNARGFFPGYLREFEPVLALLAATGLTKAVCTFGTRRAIMLLLPALIIVLAPLLVVSGILPFWVENFTLAVCSGFAVLILLCFGEVSWRKLLFAVAVSGVILGILFILRRSGGGLADASFAALVIPVIVLVLAGALLLKWMAVNHIGSHLLLSLSAFGLAFSIATAVEKGGFAFQGRWMVPDAIHTAALIKENTDADDEVMSGGVIWSYLADRYPFMKNNHPLGLILASVYDDEADEIYRSYLEKPPAIIVLDGDTKRTWYKNEQLRAAVEKDYVPLSGTTDNIKVLIHRSK